MGLVKGSLSIVRLKVLRVYSPIIRKSSSLVYQPNLKTISNAKQISLSQQHIIIHLPFDIKTPIIIIDSSQNDVTIWSNDKVLIIFHIKNVISVAEFD